MKRRVKKGPILILIVLVLAIIAYLVVVLLKDPDKKKIFKQKNEKTEEKVRKEKTKKMSLVAVGDCLIHGAVYIDARTGSNSYDFSGMVELVGPEIKDYDLKYYNQETIIGGKKLGLSHYPTFNSPEEIGDAMVNLGFNIVSLANNHTLDKGEIGILDEDEFLSAYKDGDLYEEDYKLVLKTKERLIKEINNNTNKLMNIDYNKYLKDF